MGFEILHFLENILQIRSFYKNVYIHVKITNRKIKKESLR